MIPCIRCNGRLAHQWVVTPEGSLPTVHCLNCGHVEFLGPPAPNTEASDVVEWLEEYEVVSRLR